MSNKTHLVKTRDGKNYLFPFMLITSLFFIWGFANSTLDVLNKFFQNTLDLKKSDTAWIQVMVYGAYFLMAIPAGKLIESFGYKRTVVTGLCLFSFGAFMFLPAGSMSSFPLFLAALFVIGCGLTCLETSANPYATVLGEPESAPRRLNLAQSFNGLGWIGGPVIGLALFGSNGVGSDDQLSSVSLIYVIVGVIGVTAALIFSRAKLPEIGVGENNSADTGNKSLWSYSHFTFGLVALFLYVAAQTGINSYFMNYMVDGGFLNETQASMALAFVAMVLFLLGRMVGSYLMAFVSSVTLLLICAISAALCMVLVCLEMGQVSVVAMYACYLFESIMFPTIFALAIEGLGNHAKRASSYLIMCIVGGAFAPMAMALISEVIDNVHLAYIVPFVCFVVISTYAFYMKKRV